MVDLQEDQALIGVPWRPWTGEAFRLAHERDVPILLSISAVWCHWCHVMDETTYRNPEIIRRLATEVVPIRVDADQRPDLNNRYNLGGWPSTAFLTPDGDLLTGGTFMPEEELLGTLDQVTSYYRDRREELESKVQRRRARRARISELRHRLRGNVTPEIIDTVVEAVLKAYDPRYGGFGDAPKFPLPDTIELALAMGYANRDEALLDVAGSTLTAMAQGGMYDHLAGGFFRYSTTADWSEPHYEKMLEGNARLLDVYLQAAQVFDAPQYWETARGIVAWAEATLRQPETGAFGGSSQADEEYYHLDARERAERNPPRVDETLYTDWNAMMISALLRAACLLDEPYYGDLALEVLEAIWDRNYLPGSGMAHFYDGSPHLPGLLGDQVWMGRALLDAQAYVGAGNYLERAETILDIMRARLLDPDAGGFYDIPYDPAALGRLQDRHKLLDLNSLAADLALSLGRLTGREEHEELAVDALEAMAPLYGPYRHHAAAYGLAVYRFVHSPLHLIIVGDPLARLSRSLRLAALSIYDPNRLVESVDPVRSMARLEQLGLPVRPAPALYIRRRKQTSPAIEDPAQVRAAAQAMPA